MNRLFFFFRYRRWLLPIIILSLITIVFWQYSCDKIDEKVFIGAIGTIGAAYFGLLKQWSESDKLFKELFSEFTQRYDEKYNDLLNEISSSQQKVLDKCERNLIIDYLNFCAEEYLWYSKGRIGKRIWDAWKVGIIYNLMLPPVRAVYEEEMQFDKRRSYYGLYEELGIKVD